VKDGKVTDEVLSLGDGGGRSYSSPRPTRRSTPSGRFTEDLVIVCRHSGDVRAGAARGVDFMDVSPKQLVSVAAALDPVP
jgi:DNA-directed RNA polymerase subunit beta